jgi:hypothetical protein
MPELRIIEATMAVQSMTARSLVLVIAGEGSQTFLLLLTPGQWYRQCITRASRLGDKTRPFLNRVAESLHKRRPGGQLLGIDNIGRH